MTLSKLLALVLLAMTVIALPFFGVFYFCSYEDQQEREREQEWRQYSQEHNCVVERDQSFWNAATTWKCDGGHFEVRR